MQSNWAQMDQPMRIATNARVAPLERPDRLPQHGWINDIVGASARQERRNLSRYARP